jgi:hypothetical protein
MPVTVRDIIRQIEEEGWRFMIFVAAIANSNTQPNRAA